MLIADGATKRSEGPSGSVEILSNFDCFQRNRAAVGREISVLSMKINAQPILR